MDADSWTRIAYSSSSRRHQSRSDMYHGEEYEGEVQPRPEFICPFCAEDFDIVGLFVHIDEEHAIEAKNGVCPVCVKKVGPDLVRHITVQHGNLLKVQQRRRRFRRGGSNLSLSILQKELRERNLQSPFRGSPFLACSSNIESDPMLTSFISNPAVADEALNIRPLSSADALSMPESSVDDLADRVDQQSLVSDEDLKERAQRCEFVQGLLLSTFVDNGV